MYENTLYDSVKTKKDAVFFAKRLRDAADESEQEFIRFLMWLEDKPGVWGDSKYRGFDEFLKFENVCQPSRYHNGKSAINELGEKVCEGIGIGPAKQVLRLPPLEREKAIKIFETFRTANNSYASDQHARNVVKQLGGQMSAPKEVRNLPDKTKLEEENSALKARVRELEGQVAELEKENAKLRRKGRNKNGKDTAPEQSL